MRPILNKTMHWDGNAISKAGVVAVFSLNKYGTTLKSIRFEVGERHHDGRPPREAKPFTRAEVAEGTAGGASGEGGTDPCGGSQGGAERGAFTGGFCDESAGCGGFVAVVLDVSLGESLGGSALGCGASASCSRDRHFTGTGSLGAACGAG